MYSPYRQVFLVRTIIKKRKRLVKQILEWKEYQRLAEQDFSNATVAQKRDFFGSFGFDILNMKCNLDFEDYIPQMFDVFPEELVDVSHFEKLRNGIKAELTRLTEALDKCVYHFGNETTDFRITV